MFGRVILALVLGYWLLEAYGHFKVVIKHALDPDLPFYLQVVLVAVVIFKCLCWPLFWIRSAHGTNNHHL